jgi:hypothetical protein
MWIGQHLEDFRHIAAGKAYPMGHIQRYHLSAAKVILPPPPLLALADRIKSPLIDGIWQRSVESRTLAALRDTLLPSSFPASCACRRRNGWWSGNCDPLRPGPPPSPLHPPEGLRLRPRRGLFRHPRGAGAAMPFRPRGDGAMCPNAAGEMIRRVWRDLPARFPGIRLDALAVMPNHVHGIIVLAPPDDAGDGAADDVSAGDWAATASPHAVRDDVAVGDGAGDDVSAGDWAAAASSHDSSWRRGGGELGGRGIVTRTFVAARRRGIGRAAASPHDVRGGATAGDWAAAASSHDVRGGATVEDWAATRAAPTGNGVRGARSCRGTPCGCPIRICRA